jgi:hypothetical protein
VTDLTSAGSGDIFVAKYGFAPNVAPTIESLTVPVEPMDVNAHTAQASATFSDPAGANDEPYTCTVDYDDGNGPQDGTAVWDAGLGVGTCAGPAQTYTVAGVYAVTVTVTDKDDGTGTLTATDYIVIYDPDGGFVTGGGWIDSPAGAYAPDPDLTGKANFGFVSKYKKGADKPSGNTEFQFKAGDLNFHSSSYDWLVVAGRDKAKYKGSGTINGGGNYGFMLTATDGSPDTFRIKIWNVATGDAVYDNKMGSDDDGYDGTEIGGGNIKVHKAK